MLQWRWKNFSEKEMRCTCCGELLNTMDFYDIALFFDSMDKLQKLRELWGKPIYVNSAHRCKDHNNKVGGRMSSWHLKIAFDCAIKKEEQEKFITLAEKVGFKGIGVYPNFIHLDNRPVKTRWEEK